MQLSITLPDDLAAQMRARIASGQYTSESEMVREALEELEDKDLSYGERVERWLRTEVVAACEEHRANPARGHTVDEVREALRQRRDAEDRED